MKIIKRGSGLASLALAFMLGAQPAYAQPSPPPEQPPDNSKIVTALVRDGSGTDGHSWSIPSKSKEECTKIIAALNASIRFGVTGMCLESQGLPSSQPAEYPDTIALLYKNLEKRITWNGQRSWTLPATGGFAGCLSLAQDFRNNARTANFDEIHGAYCIDRSDGNNISVRRINEVDANEARHIKRKAGELILREPRQFRP